MSVSRLYGLMFMATVLSACQISSEEGIVNVCLEIDGIRTKSVDPNETKISDINLFVFSEDGILEESKYLSNRDLNRAGGTPSMKIQLIRGVRSDIVCCANFGFRISGINSLEELSSYRYSIAYPDEYSQGIPMSGIVSATWDTGVKNITIPLKRMMSKISISMDRTDLDGDVKINVKAVRIGNCPRSASVLGPSAAKGINDVFENGFSKSFSQVDILNKEVDAGISGEVSVYMLENMRGDMLDDTVDDEGKIIEGALSNSCSYIELQVEYVSSGWHTKPDEYLRYRFFPGENNYNFDIERNCHYHFMVQPHGSGISEESWRIDKTALEAD